MPAGLIAGGENVSLHQRSGDFGEAEFVGVAPAIVTAAAGEAGGFSAQWAHAAQFHGAVRAAVEMAGADLPTREREVVAALFIREAEVAAGLLPLASVGCNAAASGAVMREQVGEFVPQRAVDFSVAEIAETGVEIDEILKRIFS